MGARFRTEKQIEANLIEEVRKLPLLDGRRIIVRAYAVNWRNYDLAVKYGVASPSQIAEALDYQGEVQGLLPGEVLGALLVPLRAAANRIMDQQLTALTLRMARREKLLRDFRKASKGDDNKPS